MMEKFTVHTMRNRIRLVWLAFTKPYVFLPTLNITDAMIHGESESTSTIIYKDGTHKILNVHIEVINEP